MVAGQVQCGDTFGNRRTRDDGRLGATIRRVLLAELPIEVAQALGRIRFGGPFPHSQDGAVFFNRQKLLPRRGVGYYREYTVETPGSQDRGARRRVVGGGGAELYYTDNHYRSFREVLDSHG